MGYFLTRSETVSSLRRILIDSIQSTVTPILHLELKSKPSIFWKVASLNTSEVYEFLLKTFFNVVNI
jgi:hypothetical protein